MQPASRSTGNISPESVLERVELSPGVFLVRYKHWHEPQVPSNQDIQDPVIIPVKPTKRGTSKLIPSWHLEAQCSGFEPEIFFGTDDLYVRPSLSRAALALAQSICEACPVRRDCLISALSVPEQYGVWGGTSGRQRDTMQAAIAKGMGLEDVVDEYLEYEL